MRVWDGFSVALKLHFQDPSLLLRVFVYDKSPAVFLNLTITLRVVVFECHMQMWAIQLSGSTSSPLLGHLAIVTFWLSH